MPAYLKTLLIAIILCGDLAFIIWYFVSSSLPFAYLIGESLVSVLVIAALFSMKVSAKKIINPN